jgi:dihydroxyacetone kinase-like protein
MKKFVNDPKDFVPEMLKGIALANPDTLKYIPDYNLIMRADIPQANKVSVMQGSGSGHEPAHVMAVGKGMLDAACPGNVFAAPPADFVYQTTKLVASPKGVLHLLNNYTGDTMSFDMGREMAEADGIEVRTVVINDDVAVKDSTYTVGRRGVAGRSGLRARQEPRRPRKARQPRGCCNPHHGHGPDRLHTARQRHADLHVG